MISGNDSVKPVAYTPSHPPLTRTGSQLQGDMNISGDVNSQDILACAAHILDRQNWGTAADVNEDGVEDVLDCQSIVLLMPQE